MGMFWTAVIAIGGAAGGLVALWVLLAAAGLDAPRRRLRGRTGAFACGACGHEAVHPAPYPPIAACPECGAAYARAGLLTPRAGLRCGPPIWVVAAAMLAVVAGATRLLAPTMAQWGNQRTVGAALVDERRLSHVLLPADGFYLAVHRDVLVGTGRPGPGGQRTLPRALVLDLVVGPGALNGPGDPAVAALPMRTLRVPAGGSGWTIEDRGGAELARGGGVEAGVARLYELGGVDPASSGRGAVTAGELERTAALARALADAPGAPPSVGPLLGGTGLRIASVFTVGRGTHLFHRAAPWGIAAGAATPVGLSLVALVVLGAMAWSRRRMVREAKRGPRGEAGAASLGDNM